MKLPKLFGRKKKSRAEDEEEDDELDDVAAGDDTEDAAPDDEIVSRSAAGGDSHGDGDGDGEDDVDGDDEFEEGPSVAAGGGRKRVILVIAAASVAVIAAGGGAWWLMSGDDPAKEAVAAPHDPHVVVLDIPPRPGEARQAAAAQPGKARTATDTLNAIAAMTDGPGAGIVVAPVQKAAFAGMAPPKAQKPLAPAPDPALVEQSAVGPLPKIGADGRKPWQAYAYPYPAADKKPRMAVIVGGLGMSREATEGAIRFLPGAVTLAFDPYGAGLADWAGLARQQGHEVLLGLPMETADFPTRDPGRYALMSAGSPADNLQRLEFLMSRFSGYVGVLTLLGSQFTLEEAQMRPVLEALNKRGLLYVDGMTTRNTVGPATAQNIGLPRGFIDLTLDDNPSKAAIGKRLAELEDLARRRGAAIALAQPLPVTIERLAAWAAALEGRDIALAPVSATIDRQPLR